MRLVLLAFALLSGNVVCACSASATADYGDAGVLPGTDGGKPPGIAEAGGPQLIPARVFGIHMAHLGAFKIDDVRLCPSSDMAGARPKSNRIPRTSYAGIVRGGFAELDDPGPGAWTAPFAVDAFGLGMAEGQTPIPCAMLESNVLYNKAHFPPANVPKPGIVALLDSQGADGGSTPDVVTIPIASMTAVPAYQIVAISKDLVSPRLIVRQGRLDGQCTTGDLYDGMGTYASALTEPKTFVPPQGDFDSDGIQVCVAPLNGMPELVISQSWTALQVASVPDTVPAELYARQALFALALVGQKNAVDPADRLHAVMIPFDVTK